MSIRRRLDKLDAALLGDPRAVKIAAEIAALSDRELLALAERMAADIRAGNVRPPMAAAGEPPSPMFAHLSDEQLLAEAAEGRRQIAERNARLGIGSPTAQLGRDS